MRVPKFRVYDKVECMMITTSDYEDLSDLFCFLKADADTGYYSELMQSTGMVDKNGKEVFEGDIVRYECCSEGYVEEVIYDDKRCNFGTIDKDGETFSFDALISDFYVNCFEVIGNIYENKELLGE